MPEDPMPFIRKYFGGGEAEPAQVAPDVAIAAASDAALLRSAAGSQGNLGLGGLAVASSTEEEESETTRRRKRGDASILLSQQIKTTTTST